MAGKFLGNCDPLSLAEFDASQASISFPYQGSVRNMSWGDFSQHLFATYESRQHEIAQQLAIANLINSLTQVRDHVAGLEKTTVSQDALNTLSTSIANLRTDQSSRIEALTSNLSALQTALAQNQIQFANTQKTLSTLSSAVDTLNADEVLDDQLVATLQTSVSTLQTNLAGLQVSTAAKDALTALQTQVNSISANEKADVQALSSSIATLNQSLADTKTTQTTQQAAVSSALAQFQNSISTLQSQQVLDEKTIGTLQTSVSTLQTNLAGLQVSTATKDALTALQTQVNSISAGAKADVQALNGTLATLNQSLVDTRSSQVNEQVRVNALIAQLQSSLNSLQSQEMPDAATITRIDNNYITLSTSLSALQASAATTSITNQINADLAALKTQEASDVKSLQNTINSVQTTLASVQSSLTANQTFDQNQSGLISSIQSAQTSANQAQLIKDAQQDALIQQLINVEIYKKNKIIRVPEDYPTIQAAIDQFKNYACTGCAIDVAAGTYDEYLFFNDIHVKGKPPLSSTVDDLAPVLGSHGLELRSRTYADGMVPDVTIRGLISFIGDLGVYGFLANLNGITADKAIGFGAFFNANLFTYDCRVNNAAANNFSGNYGDGFHARSGGNLRARKAVATGCSNGFYSYRRGYILAPAASAQNNLSFGFKCFDSSLMTVPNSSAVGVNGFTAYHGSTLIANNCTQTGNNAGTGYSNCASTIICDFSISDNNIFGFTCMYEGFISASSAISRRNSFYAYGADSGATIQADNCTARTSKIGYYAVNGSQIFAPGTSAKNLSNTTNYSPSTSDMLGNANAFIVFS